MSVALLVFAGFVSLVGLFGPAALLAWGLPGFVALWIPATLAIPQAHHPDSRRRCWSLALPIVGDNHSVRVAS